MNKKLELLKQGKYILADYRKLTTIVKLATEILEKKELEKLKEEIGHIMSKISRIYQEDYIDINEFLIRTDTSLGSFLLNPNRTIMIKGIDAYISYENVASAYLRAITSYNYKMANKIEPLLKSRIFGFVNQLNGSYDYELLEYIYWNGNLENFINGVSEDFISYFVYENDNFSLIRVPSK